MPHLGGEIGGGEGGKQGERVKLLLCCAQNVRANAPIRRDAFNVDVFVLKEKTANAFGQVAAARVDLVYEIAVGAELCRRAPLRGAKIKKARKERALQQSRKDGKAKHFVV